MGEFSKEHNPETSLKRNTRDLSFSNNLTGNIGYILPCFCKETLPGDTFSIDTLFALNFFPTYFPIQNKIRADLHFFYCRTRNVYNEFKRFQSNVSVQKPMPYLAMTDKQHFEMKPGSIYDYFNIPVTVIRPAGSYIGGDGLSTSIPTPSLSAVLSPYFPILADNTPVGAGSSTHFISSGQTVHISSYPESVVSSHIVQSGSVLSANKITALFNRDSSNRPIPIFAIPDQLGGELYGKNLSVVFNWTGSLPSDPPLVAFLAFAIVFSKEDYSDARIAIMPTTSVSRSLSGDSTKITLSGDVPSRPDILDYYDKIKSSYPGYSPRRIGFTLCVAQSSGSSTTIPLSPLTWFSGYKTTTETTTSLSSLPISQNPFLKKPLNSSVFRCYESIYNSFFRDERNNPLLVNGEPAYDEYLTSTDGGPDTFDYHLHRRNWEQDCFTTALPSPQQGNAPLVGISSLGEVTVSTEDGHVFKAQAEYAEDGDTITNVHYTPVNQDGTPMPNSVKRQLVSLATSGISINDFRNVNALQRYLETNIRRGLKYKDIMASRWGINISYAELNMPEFIGGVTEYVSPAQVNQTSQDTVDSPLGSFAGQLYCKGQSKHTIRVFCDEPGYIIGLLSVVPSPVYSQVLPKMFTKHSQLDFFNPEFGHIGLQPIPMVEVAPLQTPFDELNETFGYQRAWYDYLASFDEVHGQFRTSLRDFVMYRTYDSKPVLSEDFLLVNNRDVDNVFSVQRDSEGNSTDKIIGQLHFSVKARRPIPKYGIPRLE